MALTPTVTWQKPMREIRELYMNLSQTVFNDVSNFTRNIRLVTQHYRHSGAVLEAVLAKHIGTGPLVAMKDHEDPDTPKMFCCASLVSVR